MAKQKSIIKLEGTIGDISFYKTKDGYLAREKTAISGDRIANDPAFQRTRENGAEFGRAGKASKLLRAALRTLLLTAADKRVTSRLTQSFVKVIQADAINERGLRNVLDGEVEMLTGFEFNDTGRISTTIFAGYDGVIDRAAGTLVITFSDFVPKNEIVAPAGATHFKLRAAGASVNFEDNTYEVNIAEAADLPLTNAPVSGLQLATAVSANSTKPLFLALAIEFYQQVNTRMYTLNNGAFNGLTLIKISGL